MMDSRKMYIAVLPARICMNMISVHSAFMDSGSVSAAMRLMFLMASPLLTPRMLPLTAAEL